MILANRLNKISLSVTLVLFTVLFFLPLFTSAAGTATGLTYECGSGATAGNCEFSDLVAATQNALNKLTLLTLSFTVVVIAWAGFKYMVSGDNASERKQANEMLIKVAKGIAFILAAWLIVSLILNALGVVNTGISFT